MRTSQSVMPVLGSSIAGTLNMSVSCREDS